MEKKYYRITDWERKQLLTEEEIRDALLLQIYADYTDSKCVGPDHYEEVTYTHDFYYCIFEEDIKNYKIYMDDPRSHLVELHESGYYSADPMIIYVNKKNPDAFRILEKITGLD